MSDKILQRFSTRSGGESAIDGIVPEADDTESFGCFGFLRGVRDRAVTLELRKKSGQILAINYAFISKFEFEPATGITLTYGGEVISIKGRNLNSESRSNVRLFQGLARFRVPWVQESDRAESMKADKSAVVVESIEW